MKSPLSVAVVTAAVVLLLATGCASTPSMAPQQSPPVSAGASASATPSGAVGIEKPVAPETNPPGDIPDNQAFVPFKTASGITVKVPEGWSRQEAASSVAFTDKLNTIIVSWGPATGAPTPASFKSADVARLMKTQPAFEFSSATEVKLPVGPAVHAFYRINGRPNDVTGKQYRLAVEQYSVFRNGMRVDLTLMAPVGSDNVDPWRIVSESLSWK